MIQWILSERSQKIVVPKSFWHLSIIGNLLLAMHYALQPQGFLALLQCMNGAIAWRNLNLLSPRPWKPVTVIGLFFFLFTSFAAWISIYHVWWPVRSFYEGISIFWGWHLFGAACTFLFASRFWVQWVVSERRGVSQLSESFWILSLVGSSLSLIYFMKIQDRVSLFYALLGMVPYARNLILLARSKHTASQS